MVAWLALVVRLQAGEMIEDPLRPGQFVFVAGTGTGVMYLRALSVLLLVGAGIVAVNARRPAKLASYWLPVLALSLVYALSWYLRSFSHFLEVVYSGITPETPIVWMLLFATVARPDRSWSKRELAFLSGLTYLTLGLSWYHSISLPQFGSVRHAGVSPSTYFTVAAFWPSVFLLFKDEQPRWLGSAFQRLPIFLCLGLSVYSRSRGWTLLALLAIAIRFALDVRRGQVARYFAIWLLTGFAVAVLASYQTDRLVGNLEGLIQRLDQDTRTEQYSAFFAQMSFADLVVGAGPGSKYVLGDQTFSWIDNQYLAVLMKFGAPVLAGYFVLVLLPGLRQLSRWRTTTVLPEALTILLWCLALVGVSTYNAIDLTPQNILICWMGGRCAAAWKLKEVMEGVPRLSPYRTKPSNGDEVQMNRVRHKRLVS
ncbi:MAG: hypothetical protein IPM17_00385 [Verrucomicrobia bacterium]|nr:hypothetical protein [Verrucomicrobiota bacterium]